MWSQRATRAHDVLRALAVALALSGCTALAEEDVSEEDVPAELAAMPAPEGTRIATVRTVTVSIDVAQHAPVGRLVYLKLESPDVGQVFLGRVRPDAIVSPMFSLPRISETVSYELYDETGWRVVGEAAVSEPSE